MPRVNQRVCWQCLSILLFISRICLALNPYSSCQVPPHPPSLIHICLQMGACLHMCRMMNCILVFSDGQTKQLTYCASESGKVLLLFVVSDVCYHIRSFSDGCKKMYCVDFLEVLYAYFLACNPT